MSALEQAVEQKNVTLLSATILIINKQTTLAQSEESKVEVSMSFTTLRLSEFDRTDPGVDSRIPFNLNKHIALEDEVK